MANPNNELSGTDVNDACINSKNSKMVLSLRLDRRNQMRTIQKDQRHKKIDSIRVGIGAAVEHYADLKNYATNDVTEIANRIKHQKHAKTKDLNCLAHAFIQSTENSTCFLNITGALNVLVKELTGL